MWYVVPIAEANRDGVAYYYLCRYLVKGGVSRTIYLPSYLQLEWKRRRSRLRDASCRWGSTNAPFGPGLGKKGVPDLSGSSISPSGLSRPAIGPERASLDPRACPVTSPTGPLGRTSGPAARSAPCPRCSAPIRPRYPTIWQP